MPPRKAPSSNPYHNGTPVAFVYQESGHPASLQVRNIGKNRGAVCSSDMEVLRAETEAIRAQVVFLTQEQIGEIFSPSDTSRSRPFTAKEKEDLLG